MLTAHELMYSFEFFLPEVFRKMHEKRRNETLDGVYPSFFLKTDGREAEILGLAIFISDQTLTPVHLRLHLSPNFERVAWVDLRQVNAHGADVTASPTGSPRCIGQCSILPSDLKQ